MNSLKPLLTVAVLAGIGYGVYIRLNAGAGAPPPPVDASWNNAPAIELPGQPGAAPWGAPSASAPTAPPGVPAGGAAPPFGVVAVAPSGAGSAPPFAGPAGAPPFSSGMASPPGLAQPNTTPPVDMPVMGGAAVGEAPPAHHSEFVPPANGQPYAPPTGPDMANPYGNDSYGPPASGPDPYGNVPYGESPAGTAPAGPEPHGAAPYGTDAYAPPPAAGGEYPAAPANATGTGDFAVAMESVQRDLESGQLAAALRQLTTWYGNPQLAPHEEQRLQMLLDQVAGTVVYSTQSLLERPYEVQPGERLETISEKYQVPWQLLAKINGIQDPGSLQPGERLKVVRGPFEAIVSIDRRELVLQTADGLYAGRFKIGIGAEHPPAEGAFSVSDKSENPVYYGRDRAIGAEDPSNPLGERWIGLGQTMAIHGTNNPENIGRDDLPGWISLGERDAADVYDILSLGSRVTIRR